MTTERHEPAARRRGAAKVTRRSGPARDEYATAFERVRLVRAWIAAAAALVAVLSAGVAVIERVMR